MARDDLATDCVATVAETLMAEFHRVLPLAAISATVLRAKRELAARALDSDFADTLIRLCRSRLTQLQLEVSA